jgi:DNA-binding beta-propeller fold protein YncE
MELRRRYLRVLCASLAGAALAALAPAMALAAEGPYTITHQWKLQGSGWWDYLTVDPNAHLIYITRGDRVAIVDENTGKQVAEISGLKGVHGVALDTRGKYGYISDGGANQIVVFDRQSRARVAEIPAGTNPDGIAFEPKTQTVWAFNGRSQNATVVDAKTNKALGTVALPGKPEFPVADGRGVVFANIEDKSEMVRIDAASRQVTTTWPLAPCEGPSGLAMDQAHRRLFSVCDGGKMAVVNADSGKVVATPAIGGGPDAARFWSARQLALSSNGQGTLTVVKEESPDRYTVLQNLPTRKGARTMALDPKTGRVYLVTADFGPRPSATPDNPHPRPPVIPGSFTILVADPSGK